MLCRITVQSPLENSPKICYNGIQNILLRGICALSYRNKENNTAALVATIIFVVIVAAAVAVAVFLGGTKQTHEEEYSWIKSDSAAINGMLDGSWYSGEKNPAGTLSYKIAEEITVGSDGKGDFKIENSGKNSCLMKVKIAISGETIYETDYIKPNQHINEDMLSKLPPVGEYDADVTFEAFDPSTEASLGATGMKIKLIVVE